MSYITAIGTANPPHTHTQSDIAEFMVRAMALPDAEARKLRTIFRASGIETRHSVIGDYGRAGERDFYPPTSDLEPFPTTQQRMRLFQKHAIVISEMAVQEIWRQRAEVNPESITHLVVVSCTGMYAPGLDIDLVKVLGLPTEVQRVCINFMGCYAAFNALKLADQFCRTQPDARVLVVCTELCSIHFQKEPTEDNMLANALFADGAAAVLVEGSPRPGLNLRPASFYCDLAPEGENDMAWSVGDWGFEMRLSSYVPKIIQSGIHQLTERLLKKIDHPLQDVSYFAIHPGGKKILEVIENELRITRQQNAPAYEVLRTHGNMSSPTVLFVLKEVMGQLSNSDDEKTVLSFAFGPGLTLESMLLRILYH
jgi:predicted naringenin-chalcone synthase